MNLKKWIINAFVIVQYETEGCAYVYIIKRDDAPYC